jgi:hypothetical protein
MYFVFILLNEMQHQSSFRSYLYIYIRKKTVTTDALLFLPFVFFDVS